MRSKVNKPTQHERKRRQLERERLADAGTRASRAMEPDVDNTLSPSPGTTWFCWRCGRKPWTRKLFVWRKVRKAALIVLLLTRPCLVKRLSVLESAVVYNKRYSVYLCTHASHIILVN